VRSPRHTSPAVCLVLELWRPEEVQIGVDLSRVLLVFRYGKALWVQVGRGEDIGDVRRKSSEGSDCSSVPVCCCLIHS